MTTTPPSVLTIPLDDPRATLERVGGKGAALARARSAGFPVPDGFHVTTAAYRSFLTDNAIDREIDRALARHSAGDAAGAASLAATIQRAVAAGGMSSALRNQIAREYARLGADNPPVAVRSSATAEDLPEASFAGQQDTLLNVRGLKALLEAVLRCWASLWTERAIQYRERLGIEHRAISMGVVVQLMVPADTAGVMFTANPTTGNRSEIVVNASYGLGESVVSGQVTPDTYVLDRRTLDVRSTRIGTKEAQILSVGAGMSGTERQEVDEARWAAAALPGMALRELGALGTRVEQQFSGVPQDIEWALADGHIWLLQSRPITGLPPAPLEEARWAPPIPGSRWIRRQVVEHMPAPLSPLFEDLYLTRGLEYSVDHVLRVLRMTNVLDEFIDRPLFATVNGYAYMRADFRINLKSLWSYLFVSRFATAELFRVAIPNWRDTAVPRYLGVVQRWKRVVPDVSADDRLLAGVRELAIEDAVYWYNAALAIGVAKVTDGVLDWALGLLAPGRNLHSGQFLRGLPSPALEAEAELESLAEDIRRSPGLLDLVTDTPAAGLRRALTSRPDGLELLRGLDVYLDRFGHQIYSLDFAVPTQADDPTPVLVTLQGLARRPAPDAARQTAAARQRKALARDTGRSMDPIRRRLFRTLLRWAWRYAPYREAALFYVGAGWPTLRRLALELGARLAAVGTLGEADDVFYLTSEEIERAIAERADGRPVPELRDLVVERRALREQRKRLHPPAAVPPWFRLKFGPLDLSARESQRRDGEVGPVLHGFPVSPGHVTAPASVIRSPAEFDQMRPGTILVCPTTTPAWTPLFSQARGLVTDIGGVLAHGSIVAREYGIPAVMGTAVATQRIRSGQMISVDGDTGTVTLE